MPSQSRFILQAALLLLLILAISKSIHFLSTTQLVDNPGAISEEADEAVSVSTSASYRGRSLFRNNCAMCHAINKNLTGPGLSGITSRVTDKQLLFDWIRDNRKVLKSGNPYFNDLYKAYNKIPMPAFPSLSDEDIQLILDYIEIQEHQYLKPQPAITKL